MINNLTRYLQQEGYVLSDNDLPHDPLTTTEIKTAIDQMPLRKAAGKDGVPIEFYVVHTDEHNPDIDKACLLNFMLNMYNESYNENELTSSQSQNIVTLLFKKHLSKDRRLPKNYRPITLQNLDYKILYHILSKRLVSVIDKITPPYQHACLCSKAMH